MPISCMGAYKDNVVVVIKMGAYIHGVLTLCGCLLSRFYGIFIHKTAPVCKIVLVHIKKRCQI